MNERCTWCNDNGDSAVFQHEPGGVRLECECGVSGPLLEDLEEARNAYNFMQRMWRTGNASYVENCARD